jgi:hypothetical protein
VNHPAAAAEHACLKTTGVDLTGHLLRLTRAPDDALIAAPPDTHVDDQDW